MKKHIELVKGCMLTFLVSMLLVGCSLDNWVIDKPVFLASNTTSIEIGKVTLTDSTTVLDIYASYYSNYWIKIAKSSILTDDKGNVYPIQSGIGIELDKEFMMPESGEAEFQLVFPRLRNGAKSFDFSENLGMNGEYRIWGVQLQRKDLPELALPEELLSQDVDKDAPLEAPELKYGEAVVKGKVLDFRSGMPTTMKIIVTNPFSRDQEEADVNIEPDGSFAHSMHVLGAVNAVAFYPGMNIYAEFFVQAGQTSEVYLNVREAVRIKSKYHSESEPYGKPYYYSGPYENLVREKVDVEGSILPYKKTMGSYDFTKKPKALLEEYVSDQKEQAKKIKEVVAQSSFSQSSKEYFKVYADMYLLLNYNLAPLYLTNYYNMAQGGKLDRVVEDAYYLNLKKMMDKMPIDPETYAVLNNPVALLVMSYGDMASDASNILPNSSLGEGLFSQMGEATKIYQNIKFFMPLTEAQKETMKKLPEGCQQYLNAKNEELVAMLEANKKKTGFRMNEAGEVANEDLFASIISKYRGKVVLVDFWATWCGPCRMANKEMVPLKEELKGKDIVYVYITGETSPKEAWENMVPDLPGEHFRLTDNQWEYLRKAMGASGVPTYIVVDREGTIKYKTVGYPGNTAMKEQLLKALGK